MQRFWIESTSGKEGTYEDPWPRGGYVVYGEEFPVGHRPYPSWYMDYQGYQRTAGLRHWPETVYNNVQPTSFRLQLNLLENNAFDEVDEPVKLVVELELRDNEAEGNPVIETITLEKWVLTREAEEALGPGPELPERYHILDNEYMTVRIDKKWGGAIDGLWLPGSDHNYVDDADNGRLIQCDMHDGEKCANWELNPWTDIPHRDLHTPTQGGSAWGEANWPLEVLAESATEFQCRTRLADYWGVQDDGGRSTVWTPYIVNWYVLLDDERVIMTASIEGPRRPTSASIWWFAKGFKQFDRNARWEGNTAFKDYPEVNMSPDPAVVSGFDSHVNITSPSGRALAMWLLDSDGGESRADVGPEHISALTGIRDWDTRSVSMTLDFTEMIDGEVEPVDPDKAPEWFVDYVKALSRKNFRLTTGGSSRQQWLEKWGGAG